MFIHIKGVSLSPMCVGGQNASRGRWDVSTYGGRNDFCSPQRKLRSVVLQLETYFCAEQMSKKKSSESVQLLFVICSFLGAFVLQSV